LRRIFGIAVAGVIAERSRHGKRVSGVRIGNAHAFFGIVERVEFREFLASSLTYSVRQLSGIAGKEVKRLTRTDFIPHEQHRDLW
jgi:hypothetical protein